MTNPPLNKTAFPFSPALMAIDFAALITIGLCVAELFPKHGTPLCLLPINFVWPILLVAIVVAAICSLFQVKILLSRNKSA